MATRSQVLRASVDAGVCTLEEFLAWERGTVGPDPTPKHNWIAEGF